MHARHAVASLTLSLLVLGGCQARDLTLEITGGAPAAVVHEVMVFASAAECPTLEQIRTGERRPSEVLTVTSAVELTSPPPVAGALAVVARDEACRPVAYGCGLVQGSTLTLELSPAEPGDMACAPGWACAAGACVQLADCAGAECRVLDVEPRVHALVEPEAAEYGRWVSLAQAPGGPLYVGLVADERPQLVRVPEEWNPEAASPLMLWDDPSASAFAVDSFALRADESGEVHYGASGALEDGGSISHAVGTLSAGGRAIDSFTAGARGVGQTVIAGRADVRHVLRTWLPDAPTAFGSLPPSAIVEERVSGDSLSFSDGPLFASGSTGPWMAIETHSTGSMELWNAVDGSRWRLSDVDGRRPSLTHLGSDRYALAFVTTDGEVGLRRLSCPDAGDCTETPPPTSGGWSGARAVELVALRDGFLLVIAADRGAGTVVEAALLDAALALRAPTITLSVHPSRQAVDVEALLLEVPGRLRLAVAMTLAPVGSVTPSDVILVRASWGEGTLQ